MDIHLNQNDGVPVYLQIINQVKHLVSSKRLVTDQELPAIRVLAEQILVNPNTVARAYRELEIAGWLYKKRGAGTFVSGKASPLSDSERNRIIDEKIKGLLAEARQMDISITSLINRLKELSLKK
ncbi:MAG: GntR family transcriptional regulator [Gammaproteobacteria bacterium]|nr:MAG: GntR family transcriptional regulator [Gammaproteobacteria bacterium]